MNNSDLIKRIDWKKSNGLVPAIVQCHESGNVLMLGYMNSEALMKTLNDNKVTFWSRSRQELWQKGETSGNYLQFIKAELDCDNDTLLVQAKPVGPTCHTGSDTCFGENKKFTNDNGIGFLLELEKVIKARKAQHTDFSYTSSLFKKGMTKIAQKVGEEGVEVVIAGLAEDDKNLISESADLIYHLLVLLTERDINFSQVVDTLQSRS